MQDREMHNEACAARAVYLAPVTCVMFISKKYVNESQYDCFLL